MTEILTAALCSVPM